jgi:predicted O-methyltransferase YrrM
MIKLLKKLAHKIFRNQLHRLALRKIRCNPIGNSALIGAPAINNSFNHIWALSPRVTSPLEHVALFNLAALTQGDAVEVGCYLGYSTIMIATAFNGTSRKVHAIDLFCLERGVTNAGDDNWIYERYSQKEFAEKQLRDTACADNAVFYQMKSSEAAAKMAHLQNVDLVFIDGDHTYQGCRADLMQYTPMLVPGGYLVMHDYICARWPGVKKAVDEFVTTTPGYCRKFVVNSMLVLQKKTRAD